MIRPQDLNCSDYSLFQQFVNYWNNSNYSQMLNVLSETQLENKGTVAELVNAAQNVVLALENYYYNGVEGKLSELLTDYTNLVNQFIDELNYSAETVYYKGNIVHYNNNLYVYINDTPTSAIPPTITTYWALLGLRGKQGNYGIDLVMRYNWSSNTQYFVNDIVIYEGVAYYAKQDNINSTPNGASSDWGVLFEFVQAVLSLMSTSPANPYMGQIWFEEVV